MIVVKMKTMMTTGLRQMTNTRLGLHPKLELNLGNSSRTGLIQLIKPTHLRHQVTTTSDLISDLINDLINYLSSGTTLPVSR